MITIIVAADMNNAIGKGGKLPWHLGEDMRRFRVHTAGNIILMGRKTYESIGKALPNRTNVVVSTSPEFNPEDAIVLRSMADVMKFYLDNLDKDIMVIGGASLYRYFWYVADVIMLTRVMTRIVGADTFVPEIDETMYEEVYAKDSHERDENNDYPTEFIYYRRKEYV